MLTKEQIQQYVNELDRRWRHRTPAQDIDEVLPETRVGRSELRAWAVDEFGFWSLDCELQVQPAVADLFAALRREFPTERWED